MHHHHHQFSWNGTERGSPVSSPSSFSLRRRFDRNGPLRDPARMPIRRTPRKQRSENANAMPATGREGTPAFSVIGTVGISGSGAVAAPGRSLPAMKKGRNDSNPPKSGGRAADDSSIDRKRDFVGCFFNFAYNIKDNYEKTKRFRRIACKTLG